MLFKNNYPGPGAYRVNNDLFGSNNKQMKFSYEDQFDKKSFTEKEIAKNPDKMTKKYLKIKDLPKFKLKNRTHRKNNFKIIRNEEYITYQKKRCNSQNDNNFEKLNFILKNQPKKEEKSYNLKFKIEEQNELAYIKTILGNDHGRPDLFFLSSERWKDNKYKLKTPGPAYYFNY